MIERNLLDQTKDLRGPQRMVQSNFGMEEQRRIADQRMAQNNLELELPNRGGGMPANPDGRSYAGGSPGLYAPGGKFYRVGGIIQRQNDENSKLKSFRQLQNNLEPADAQPIRGNNRPVFDVIKFDGSGTIPNRVDRGGRNPSQTYQNQENRSFSNSYGNSYGNSMSGYQPQYGSRGGFGMQQPMYGGGMQSPFGGYGMQSPFGSYGGGMQQPMYGGGMQSPFGGYGMQQPMYGGMQQGYGMQSPYGGYGMQQPQYQSSPFSPQFGSRPQMTYGGEYGGYNTQRDYDQRPQTQLGPSGMLMPQMRTM
jgi:hypothetical protein